MIKHTFVDLDGVLANFNLKVVEIFGVPYPSRSVTGWEWIGDQRPDLKRAGFHEALAQHPDHYQGYQPIRGTPGWSPCSTCTPPARRS